MNRKLPDAAGDVDLSVVPLAENLQSDKLQNIEGEFILRTTGGTGSVSDGKAYPQHIYGNSRHDGFVAEVLNLTVIPITRTEPDEPITATIDRGTFVAAVTEDSTINLYYTTEWSEDPEDYGVTVTGDPVAGDQITIVYVKEVRGTIVVAEPDRLVGTGWNLYDANHEYARVVKYSDVYGYKVGGTYTSLTFSPTLTGERTSILPNANGLFNVTSDGYVFVAGGNATDTYILATWSDWTNGPSTGYWEAYRESGIDLSAVVETYFPYGLLKVGMVRDEIDLVAKKSISRIERMVYSAENRATAEASGRSYDFDENNIYLVRAESVQSAITIGTDYSVSEHGLEWFTETELPLDTEILYGKNLRDKLERDVVTISAQTLTEEEKAQVRTNIGAMSQAEGDTKLVAPTAAGTTGQLLSRKADGGTEWTTQGTPTDAQVGTAVSAWLEAHPEATTTVEDGAISRAKLNADLQAKTDAVPELKSAINVVLLKAKYGFSENEGGPSSMNSSSALYDHRRVYINTANSANKDRLMVYDYTTSLWGWLGELKKQDVQGIIDNSHYAMMQYISTLLMDKGYIVYPYGILEINSDSSVDTSMIYVATTNTAANQRLMWYDGINWNYALDIKITDFPFLTSITGKLAREESNILLSKSMFGITEYTGGISAINTNDADRQKIYVANVSGQNNGRFMYYNSSASEWQYLGDCYKSGFSSLVTESQKMLRQYLVARLLEEGYLEYAGGVASLNNDASADTSRIYVAKTATANNNKLMWHDGYKWTYVDSVNNGDNIKISDLGNVDEILISSKRDYNYTDISSYVAGKLENIFDFNSATKFVNLAFLTDTHRNVHDDSTILQYLKELELTDFLDAYVHGGDIIETYNMTRSQWIIAMGENIQAYKFYKNIMFIKGNHDNNHSETASENITNSQYKMVMNDFVTGLVFDESNASTCYYYKDFPYEKVRIVVLDTFEGSDENVSITNAQIDWLYTKALDVNDGWTILLLSHMTPVSVGKCKRILQAFNDRGTQYGDYLFPDTITTYFAGIIHGHQHSDGYDNSNGFNDISVTCGYGDGYGMDVATVDTSNKILHLTRFGSGSDRNYTFGESSGPVT